VVLDSRAASRLTPSAVATIKAAVLQSTTAADLMQKLKTGDNLRMVVGGMSSQTFRVHLENAP
jgi:hypothetical protein